jgi:hypothetical protein
LEGEKIFNSLHGGSGPVEGWVEVIVRVFRGGESKVKVSHYHCGLLVAGGGKELVEGLQALVVQCWAGGKVQVDYL